MRCAHGVQRFAKGVSDPPRLRAFDPPCIAYPKGTARQAQGMRRHRKHRLRSPTFEVERPPRGPGAQPSVVGLATKACRRPARLACARARTGHVSQEVHAEPPLATKRSRKMTHTYRHTDRKDTRHTALAHDAPNTRRLRRPRAARPSRSGCPAQVRPEPARHRRSTPAHAGRGAPRAKGPREEVPTNAQKTPNRRARSCRPHAPLTRTAHAAHARCAHVRDRDTTGEKGHRKEGRT